jgi:hypothetical protein
MLMENKEVAASPDIEIDERYVLLQRIVATHPFQKSERFRNLLSYLVEKSIHGKPGDFNESKIGVQIFHRPADYSPVEDSTVRVHIRQLRLKLHEYFDSEGRNETLILEIPKGGFTPVFRAATQRVYDHLSADQVETEPAILRKQRWIWTLGGACILLATACGIFAYQLMFRSAVQPSIGPLDAIFSKDRATNVVVGDVNYGIHSMMAGKRDTLQEYLDDNSQGIPPALPENSPIMVDLMHYIKTSNLTSFADAAVVATLSALANERGSQVQVRPARELHLRDFENGNFILIGGAASDPWVYLFQNRLNFQLSEDPATKRSVWLNKNPQPGEQKSYQGLVSTGSGGEEYADIALIPAENGQGIVMIIQGIQQEGTESAGRFLADPAAREALTKMLREKESGSPYFEVLLKTSTVAGAPAIATVVAARAIPKR